MKKRNFVTLIITLCILLGGEISIIPLDLPYEV